MNFGMFEGESEDLNPKGKVVFGTFCLDYGGESREQVRERMVKTCIEIMEKEDHQVVLAAGACLQFMHEWQGPTEELKRDLLIVVSSSMSMGINNLN